MIFSAHNVRLRDGSLTMNDGTPLLADYNRSLLQTLRLGLGGDLVGKSIVDLGCLEGGYTVEFARCGMISVGIDARHTNIEKCEYVRKNVGLINLSFIKDDVMNIGTYGQFDAAFCYGLLYHLDNPRAFMRELSHVARRIIIINTHVGCEDLEINPHGLSDLTENEGLLGRWYNEHSAITDSEKESHILSSWNNHRSFWPTKTALIQIVEENGFDLIFEQYDWMENCGHALASGEYTRQQRVQIVGVRSNALDLGRSLLASHPA